MADDIDAPAPVYCCECGRACPAVRWFCPWPSASVPNAGCSARACSEECLNAHTRRHLERQARAHDSRPQRRPGAERGEHQTVPGEEDPNP